MLRRWEYLWWFSKHSVKLKLISLRVQSTDEDDDTDRTSDYANHFFDAFKDSSIFTRRDVDFIYELAENTTRLILDENLNEDSLAAQV